LIVGLESHSSEPLENKQDSGLPSPRLWNSGPRFCELNLKASQVQRTLGVVLCVCLQVQVMMLWAAA